MQRARVQIWLVTACALTACGRLHFGAGDDASASDADAAGGATDAGNQAVPPDFTAGTRLLPVVADDGAGTQTLMSWYDTLLDERCAFGTAADGVARCLPTSASIEEFSDAGCTASLAYVDPAQLAASCDLRVHYATSPATGDVFTLATQQFAGQAYNGTPASCAAVPAMAGLFAVTGIAPPSTFVAAREQLVPHGRMSSIEWIADDGATQLTTRMVDGVLGARCTVLEEEPGEAECVSDDTPAAAQLLFADAACSVPVIDSYVAYAANITAVFVQTPSVCSNNVRMFSLGSPTSEPLYAMGSAGCAPYTRTANDHAYTTTAELPFSRFETFHLEIDAGAGRLRRAHWRDADGNGVPTDLYDSARGGRCDPLVEATSSELVCAPREVDAGLAFYSESTCTTYVLQGKAACRDASSGIWYPAADGQPNTCDGWRYDISYFDTAVPGGMVLYARIAGTCVAVDTTATPVVQASASYMPAASMQALTVHH